MFNRQDKNEIRKIRHERVRRKISGTSERPRLSVYRSLKHIYAQLIDDSKGVTLVSASTVDAEVRKALEGDKKSEAAAVGKEIAKRAISAGYKNVVFDRGGYVYTGRVAEVAKGAREAGLDF
jgi:large subunit ribosomal protein L18